MMPTEKLWQPLQPGGPSPRKQNVSELVCTVSFLREGHAPFGPKLKEARVFAQQLAGGSTLTVFTDLWAGTDPIRVRGGGLPSHLLFMAGFALADRELPLTQQASDVATRLRKSPDAELTMTRKDAEVLASAVSGLAVTGLIVRMGRSAPEIDLDAFADWAVSMTDYAA